MTKVLLHNEDVPEDVVREDNLRPGAVVRGRSGDLWWRSRDGWMLLSGHGWESISQDFLDPYWAPYTLFRDGGECEPIQA